MGIDQEIVIV